MQVAGQIPPGNVSTYGEVAKAAGTGARFVGTVMRKHGQDLAWWRVVRADGSSHDRVRSQPHWEAEGIAHSGGKVDLKHCGLDHQDLERLMAEAAGEV